MFSSLGLCLLSPLLIFQYCQQRIIYIFIFFFSFSFTFCFQHQHPVHGTHQHLAGDHYMVLPEIVLRCTIYEVGENALFTLFRIFL